MTAEGREFMERNVSNKERVFRSLSGRHGSGMTAREVSSALGLHHGSASSALSTLHKEGRVSRLKEKRNGYTLYVTVGFEQGRETKPYQKQKGDSSGHIEAAELRKQVERLEDVINDCLQVFDDPRLSNMNAIRKVTQKLKAATV